MNESPRVFVYGTLRRGASNSWRMAGAEFIGAGTVRGALFRIDWYPGLVLDANGGGVKGEVFRVDAGLLEKLDEYEGCEYRRVIAEVTLDDGIRCEVWVWEYLEPVDAKARIASGDWCI